MTQLRQILMLDAMRCFRRNRMFRWSIEESEPLLVYQSAKGEVSPLFQELLLSPIQSSRNRFYQGLYAGYNHARKEDFQEWTDWLFDEGHALHAFSEIAAKYQLPPIGIWLTLPYPPAGNYIYEDQGKTRTFSVSVERLLVLYDWIETVLKLWETRLAAGSVRLLGFVWGREGIPEADKEVIRMCNEWIGTYGLERMWLPNYRSAGVIDWKQYGFTQVSIFSNYTGNSEYGAEWLHHTSKFAAINGLGIQIVNGKGSFYDSHHFEAYLAMKNAYRIMGGNGPVVYRFPNRSPLELLQSDKGGYEKVCRSVMIPSRSLPKGGDF